MTPAQRVAGVMAAAALAVGTIATFEGTVRVGYRDPVGLPTSCVGHTGPDAIVGRKYTDEECAQQLATDALRHGMDISHCLPDELPTETRAAFTSFAFNIGAAKFCASSASIKARSGDLAGACAELPRWIYANRKPLPGLIRRRAAEKALCLKGLNP